MNSICEKIYVYGVTKLACPSNLSLSLCIYTKGIRSMYSLHFLLLSVWLHQTRIGLSSYDVAGQRVSSGICKY